MTEIGPILQSAAMRRLRRQRRNFRQSPMRAHWIANLATLAVLSFLASIVFIKGFGL